MTMQITVTNKDAARTAEVEDQEFRIGETQPVRTDVVRLSPGESRSFWIHASRRLIVTEKP